MRQPMRRLAPLLLLLVPLAGAWTWPVSGPVLQAFSFDRAQPYAAGQHRGIDVGAPAGSSVVAPAAGVVAFAGTVPASGKTVTIDVTAGTVKSVSASEITLDVNGDEGDKSFSIPEGVTAPDGLKEGDRAAVIVKDGMVTHVISGHFPFLPGLLPDGLKPFHEGPKPTPQSSNSTPQT